MELLPSLKDEFEISVYIDYLEERGDPIARPLRFFRPLRHEENEYRRWKLPLCWAKEAGVQSSRFVVSVGLFDRLKAPIAVMHGSNGVDYEVGHMREYATLEDAMLDFIQAWRQVYQ